MSRQTEQIQSDAILAAVMALICSTPRPRPLFLEDDRMQVLIVDVLRCPIASSRRRGGDVRLWVAILPRASLSFDVEVLQIPTARGLLFIRFRVDVESLQFSFRKITWAWPVAGGLQNQWLQNGAPC